MSTKRFFNNAGPTDCAKHYCLNPLERLNLAELEDLIAQERYFVLHAPRQTGKTSSLLALMAHLNAQGRYPCLYSNVEVGQAAREAIARAMRLILDELARNADLYLGDQTPAAIRDRLVNSGGLEGSLAELLASIRMTWNISLILV